MLTVFLSAPRPGFCKCRRLIVVQVTHIRRDVTLMHGPRGLDTPPRTMMPVWDEHIKDLVLVTEMVLYVISIPITTAGANGFHQDY